MTNSEALGFYYIIFQNFSDNYVKCWFDGSDAYTLIARDTFLNYTQNLKDSLYIRHQLENLLSTTSIYMLDVDNERIVRLKAGQEIEDSSSLLKELNKIKDSAFIKPSNTDFYQNSLNILNKLF